MAEALGFLSICGVGEEVTWGTAVTVTQRVPFLSEGLDAAFAKLPDQALEGQAAPRAADQGMQKIAGPLPTVWRYNTGQLLLKHFFGQLSAGTYTMLNTLRGKGLTLALEKEVNVWEFAGVKADQLEIVATAESVSIAYSLLAKSYTRASGVNTSETLAGLADTADNLLLTDVDLRIGDLADALTGSDAFGVEEISLTIQRGIAEAYDNRARQTLEQLEGARRTCKLQLKLPRYSVDTFQDWHDADTKLQARIHFAGAGGKTKTILLPVFTLDRAPAFVGGPGHIVVDLEATCYRNIGNAWMAPTAEIGITET